MSLGLYHGMAVLSAQSLKRVRTPPGPGASSSDSVFRFETTDDSNNERGHWHVIFEPSEEQHILYGDAKLENSRFASVRAVSSFIDLLEPGPSQRPPGR